MYLKSLELAGFKSFAKKSELQFSSSISGIVGPNGSGKSNIAEAFRFVLGEQSIKSMRGKRGEDLIFNGSKTQGRLNRAFVKVVFDNKKKVLPLDFDEVSIERAVNRDGTNEYSINGTKVRLRDIIELLAKAHVGASGHHIISQGEADQILNTSAKERKEIIEDALGLRLFHYKKDESERKLEKTKENIATVETLRKEIAPHLKFLKKQVEKVEKALSMKENLKLLTLEYFKREEVYINTRQAQIAKEKRGPQGELEVLEQTLLVLKKELEGSNEKGKEGDELSHLEERMRKAREEKDTLSRALGRLEAMISLEEKREERERRMAIAAGEASVPLSELEAFQRKVDISITDADQTVDLMKLKHLLQNIKTLLGELVTKYKKVVQKVAGDTEHDLATLKKERAETEAKFRMLDSEEKQLQSRYAELRRAIESKKDNLRAAERQMFEIIGKQNILRSKLSEFRGEEDRLSLLEADMKREMGEAAALLGIDAVPKRDFVLKIDEHTVSDSEIMTEARVKQEERRREIEKVKIRLEDLGSGGGEEMLKEFTELTERDQFLAREIEDLEKSAESLKGLIAELGERLKSDFKEGVEKINKEFEKYFSLMFGGGRASITLIKAKPRRKLMEGEEEMVSPEEALLAAEAAEEGIEVDIALPHKKVKGLEMLSGGERALTSIALLFAISQVNPPPFIILDETDAALDEANSRKYGDMIENLSKHSQLILITHNRETMSRAGLLYGVTMGSDGISKLLSIQFEEALVVAK